MNSMRLIKLLCIATLLLIASAGCYYDKEDLLYPGSDINCGTITATFVSVKSIIAANCTTTGCHNAGAAAGGTVLETYDQIRAKASRINQRTIIEKTMPPAKALSPGEIAILKCWISSGTPNN